MGESKSILQELLAGVSKEMSSLSEPVVFSQPVVASTGAVIINEAPFKGVIKDLTFHFPTGCGGPAGNLVDVAFKALRGRWPRTGFIALDDATETYRNVNIPVHRWEILEVEIWNRDLVFTHTPAVIALIEKRW